LLAARTGGGKASRHYRQLPGLFSSNKGQTMNRNTWIIIIVAVIVIIGLI
jgi:hypothetical protein